MGLANELNTYLTLSGALFAVGMSFRYREKIELPFFRHYLKGDPNYTVTKAHVFETGTNQWRRFDAWPPKQAQTRG